MCETCGCSSGENEVKIFKLGDVNLSDKINVHHAHHQHDDHHHHGEHSHTHGGEVRIKVEEDILGKNNLLAERNKGYFEAKSILAINIIGSPGAGKTMILEKTLSDLKADISFYVIEGDQQTANDAERINKAGASVIQINTGNGCHLDAAMINQAAKKLEIPDKSVLIIENVGNLVCPALFDLGEHFRIVLFSVTEGDDKPLKYPNAFQTAQICLINKIDLLPYVDFSVETAKNHARSINPNIMFFEVSARTGEGLQSFYTWIKSNILA